MIRKAFCLSILLVLLLVAQVFAAGSCTETSGWIGKPGNLFQVTFACTGDSSNGSIPNKAFSTTAMADALGLYLYTVEAYPTSGGTAPDAADVFILDAKGEDLLGSTDGGTTANKGANLIHATLKKTTLPYTHYLSNYYYPPVKNTLTLKVSNQATASANYTIICTFGR